MRRITISICCLLASCLLMSCALFKGSSSTANQPSPEAVQTENPPSVTLAETSFNFGKISEDGDYTHDFKVRNEGTGVLEIKKVLPG